MFCKFVKPFQDISSPLIAYKGKQRNKNVVQPRIFSFTVCITMSPTFISSVFFFASTDLKVLPLYVSSNYWKQFANILIALGNSLMSSSLSIISGFLIIVVLTIFLQHVA